MRSALHDLDLQNLDVVHAGDTTFALAPKMRAVAEATNTIDTVRLAVLAALNIADEYHLLKKRQDVGATDYQKRRIY